MLWVSDRGLTGLTVAWMSSKKDDEEEWYLGLLKA
jgi:hypothetical protein